MVDVRYDKSHHAGGTPEARVNNRLRNSGAGAKPNVTVQNGESAQRVFHNIHHAGHYVDPSTAARESGPQEQRHHDTATHQTTSFTPQDRGRGDGR
jgi:hypothetical protein